MLRELASGKEKSRLVIIEEGGHDQHGIMLLKAFLLSLSVRYEKIILALCENSKSRLVGTLPTTIVQKLQIFDASVDPLGWDGGTVHVETVLSTILADLQNSGLAAGSSALVVDGLNTMAMHLGGAYCSQALHQLMQCPSTTSTGPILDQTVASVNSDLIDGRCGSMIAHTSSTVISCTSPLTTLHSMVCDILHKRNTGKVSKMKEQVLFGDNFELLECGAVTTLAGGLPQDSSIIDEFAAGLTFNIKISEAEKEARAKVPLPYIRDRTKEVGEVHRHTGGQVFYQPDEADGLEEEEDPDADLDI